MKTRLIDNQKIRLVIDYENGFQSGVLSDRFGVLEGHLDDSTMRRVKAAVSTYPGFMDFRKQGKHINVATGQVGTENACGAPKGALIQGNGRTC